MDLQDQARERDVGAPPIRPIAAGMGADYFDFTALKGTTLTAAYTTDKSINIQLATTMATSATVTGPGNSRCEPSGSVM